MAARPAKPAAPPAASTRLQRSDGFPRAPGTLAWPTTGSPQRPALSLPSCPEGERAAAASPRARAQAIRRTRETLGQLWPTEGVTHRRQGDQVGDDAAGGLAAIMTVLRKGMQDEVGLHIGYQSNIAMTIFEVAYQASPGEGE